MDRPLRFCMITAFYPPYNFGGDGVYVHRLSNELARRGHHVEVIHCKDAYRLFADEEPPGTYQDHPNVTVHGLESPLGFLSPLLTHQTGLPLLKTRKMRAILDKGFDVIHFHTVSLIGGPGVLRYGQGIKLYTTHDHWWVCQSRELYRFNRAVCAESRYCALCNLMRRRPPQLWRYTGLLQSGARHVDAFIAPSRFTQQMHRERGLDARIVHLPYFVPAGDSSPPDLSNPAGSDGRPYFLFVGRLFKIKGLQTIIPIFRRYDKAQLLVAGTGRDEDELHRLAANHPNIRFLGQQSQQELQNLYRHAVALIAPSITYEVAGVVIIEAFERQTPAIVRDLGGMPEHVRESGGGFVYDTEDELIAAMDKLLARPALRRELGQKAYQAYQRLWTPEAHVERYLELIRDIADRKASRGGAITGAAPQPGSDAGR